MPGKRVWRFSVPVNAAQAAGVTEGLAAKSARVL
jgi:hypothetical protein